MEDFLRQYGYWILAGSLFAKSFPVLGSFASGATILYLSGLFAGVGEFNIGVVLLIAFAAVLIGDNIMFFIGKYFSDKFPKVQKTQDKIQQWLDVTQEGKNKITFLYMFNGFLRNYLPFVLGYSKMDNIKWLSKVSTSAFLFIPTASMLGFTVGKMNISNGYKAIISTAFYLSSLLLFTKISHQIYRSTGFSVNQLKSKLRSK